MRTFTLIVCFLCCATQTSFGQRDRSTTASYNQPAVRTDILNELLYQLSTLNTSLHENNKKVARLDATVTGLSSNYGLLKDNVRNYGDLIQGLRDFVSLLNSTIMQEIVSIKLELYTQQKNQERISEALETLSQTAMATSPAILKAGGVTGPPEEPKTQFRIVCHFINWGSDRKEGVFIPEDVDLNLCTHINYAFASLDPSNLLIKEGNVFVDIRNNFYQRLTSRKQRNPRLKILLSLGGYVDSAGDKYSRLARNVTARRIFKEDVIIFLRKHGFDGLNIQWQYPSCWQSNCDNSPPEDRQNFVQWLQELREAFDRQRPRLLLTVSVSKSSLIISHAYDVPALARVVDYINVMTYDYPGVSTDLRTRHPAPLYYSDGYSDDVFSVNASMHYWLKSGAPANKLIMEIQTYGRSFTLSNPRQTGLNAPARTEGRPGEISNELGKLAYFEICQRVKNRGWTKRADSLGGSYAYSGDQWVAYDDIEDVVRKARYVKDNNFGGIGVWDTSMDDFKPMCCRVANPLLNAVTYVLRGIGTEAKDLGCD